jgi:predicted phosphoserine aminotransferase
MRPPRLFIPGPVEIPESTSTAQTRPMIGHRAPEYRELQSHVVPKLRTLLEAERARVLLFTCSATGVMEAAVRNCVSRRMLALTCGAFSERFAEIGRECGKEVETLDVEWGEAIDPAAVAERLAEGEFDAVTLVHNETSTGVMNDLPGIARAVRKVGGDDVCLLVDAVTSMSAVPIPVDALDLDVCLAGSQKAFAMPPGLTVATVSERALERAATIPGRGFYFDFLRAAKSAEKNETPSTPAISLIYALDASLDLMFEEGLGARYQRHRDLAAMAREWIADRYELFPPASHASVTLSVARNTRDTDIAAMNAFLRERGVMIANGYGKLKNETFRIGHMGEVRPDDLRQVLGWMADFVLGN